MESPAALWCWLWVNVDALHRELAAKGVPIALEPTDQTWGNREMYVRDPDNNCVRFIQPSKQ